MRDCCCLLSLRLLINWANWYQCKFDLHLLPLIIAQSGVYEDRKPTLGNWNALSLHKIRRAVLSFDGSATILNAYLNN